MDYNYEKWNNYTIGNIPWINSRKSHLCRKKFIDYVSNSSFKNILEVGAGEVIEGQIIREVDKDINYNILDVSDTFLENAKILGFKVFKGEMHNTNFKDKQFDLVYLTSVLEHSPDIEKTFKEFKRISKNFYFTMFKWRTKTGGLKSDFHNKRKYFTSVFNINKLLALLAEYGSINRLFICTEKGKVVNFSKYKKQFKNVDLHRNGNYLSIVGEFYD